MTRWLTANLPKALVVIAGMLLTAVTYGVLPPPAQTALVLAVSLPVSPTPADEAPRIGIAPARALKDALFVDVRGPIEFEAGHIPGALSIPSPELDQSLGKLPKDRTLIFYCT